MRLTPSWIRSSFGSSDDERSGDDGARPAVTIHYNSPGDAVKTAPVDPAGGETVAEYGPDSDATLLAVLEEMETPATVDSIVDQLLGSDATIETFAGVHERLYEDRLPELDDAGVITFDPECGSVDVHQPDASSGLDASMPIVAFACVGILFVFAIAWMTSVLTALTFTFVVVSLIAWFVPLSGFF